MTGESARHGKPAWKESLERIRRGEEADRRRRRESFENPPWPFVSDEPLTERDVAVANEMIAEYERSEAARVRAKRVEAARVEAELSLLHYEVYLEATGHRFDAQQVRKFIREVLGPQGMRQREDQA